MSNFNATVISVDQKEQSIVLDSTAFYPTGGHQHCDQGRIEKDRRNYLVIEDVKKDDSGRVFHHFVAARGELGPGDTIKGTIHWHRRFRHMQLHTSQHIFSRLANDRFGICTGRADFAPDGGLIVMEKPLTWEQIMLLEDDVNRVITAGRGISRTINDQGVITITVDQVDDTFCGGTHVRSTAEIGIFKITSVSSKNILYEVGERARKVAVRMANDAIETSSLLKLSDSRQLADRVQMLLAQKDEADQRLGEWKEQTTQKQISKATQSAKPMNGLATIYSLDLSHLSTKAVKLLVKRELISDKQVWICLAERRNLLISSAAETVNANDILQEFICEWGINGGGNPGMAQGGPVPQNIHDPLGRVRDWLISKSD